MDNSAALEICMYILHSFLLKLFQQDSAVTVMAKATLDMSWNFSHGASTPENPASPYLSFSSHAYLWDLLKVPFSMIPNQ